MNIGVIGAGWLGKPLAYTLAKKHSVWAASRNPDKRSEFSKNGVVPIAIDGLGEVDAFPNDPFDFLFILLPPSAYVNDRGLPNERFADWVNGTARYVVFSSSTSVYPTSSVIYREEDAQHIVSKHSGLDLLAIEEWNRSYFHVPLTTLRLGGLAGNGRAPWSRNLESWKNEKTSINYLHHHDAVSALLTVVEKAEAGTFNVCCPKAVAKAEVYAKLKGETVDDHSLSCGRQISSERFQDTFSFVFQYTSVLDFPELEQD